MAEIGGGHKVLNRFLWWRSGRQHATEEKGMHVIIGFSYMANYLLVTCYLGFPYAFFHGGILASVLTLVVICFASRFTADWVLEVMARAQAISDLEATSSPVSELPKFYLKQKFEIGKLCQMFLGRWGHAFAILIIVGSTFVYLVASAAVVGSTLSVNIPLDFAGMRQCNSTDFHMHVLPSDISCRNAYWFCLFLLAVIVVPLSMVSITKQAALQMVMNTLRIATIGAMLIFVFVNFISTGSAACLCHQPWRQSSANGSNQSTSHSVCSATSSVLDVIFHFQFEKWTPLIPLLIASLNIHSSIPSLTHPLRQKNQLRSLLDVLYIFLGLLYASLGMMPLWWRNCINENCSLNWAPLIHPSFSLSLRVFSYAILLLPTLDILTAYSISIIITSNNIYTIFTGKDSTEAGKSWFTCIFLLVIKFVSAMVPILVAVGVSNLVTVLKYLGLITFFHSFGIPIALQLSSQWICYKKFKQTHQSSYDLQESSSFNGNGSNNNHRQERSRLVQSSSVPSSVKPSDLYMTPYSTIFSHWPAVVILGVISFVMLTLTIISLFNV